MDGQKMVSVGMGELQVSKDPYVVLAAFGLGSCVGVSAYDPVTRTGALAHVMLPSVEEATGQSPSYKFADVAVPAMFEKMARLGANPKRTKICLVGGAHVLQSLNNVNGFKIGERNLAAVVKALTRFGVSASVVEAGGSRGRTMRLHIDTGKAFVRVAGEEDIELRAGRP